MDLSHKVGNHWSMWPTWHFFAPSFWGYMTLHIGIHGFEPNIFIYISYHSFLIGICNFVTLFLPHLQDLHFTNSLELRAFIFLKNNIFLKCYLVSAMLLPRDQYSNYETQNITALQMVISHREKASGWDIRNASTLSQATYNWGPLAIK